MAKVSPIVAIRNYMEADGGRKVTMEEIKAFNAATPKPDILALARQAAAQLGIELEIDPNVYPDA